MNKIYNKELYYFSLITFLINPLDFISNNDGIIINLNNSHKLVIRGNIINSLENEFYIPKNIIDIVKEKFDKKICVFVELYDKYGSIGKSFFEKYIPNNKIHLFENNDYEEILNFILESNNKFKNILNFNIQYESSSIRITKEINQNILSYLNQSLKKCKDMIVYKTLKKCKVI